jgi:prenyltransferase beta subunit
MPKLRNQRTLIQRMPVSHHKLRDHMLPNLSSQQKGVSDDSEERQSVFHGVYSWKV